MFYSAEQAVLSQQDQPSLKPVVIEIDGDVVNLKEPKNPGETTRQSGPLLFRGCAHCEMDAVDTTN